MPANGIFYFFSRTTLFLFFTVGAMLTVYGQNCEVDFIGSSSQNYSGACAAATIDRLELGNTDYIGDNDVFTFDSPANITITEDLMINAEGNGKIIIPAGVTVNVGRHIKFIPRDGGCENGNACTFEIIVNGTLNGAVDLENSLETLVWSGTGTVSITNHFENMTSGCMKCSDGSCPAFPTGVGCQDNGNNCGGADFCADSYGNSTPTQNDVTPPVISNCPVNQEVNMTGSDCNETVSWTPPNATDNVGVISFGSNFNSGDEFPLGTTAVTYTARDAAGNSSNCSFNVTVNDKILPVISNCPADIAVTITGSNCEEIVSWTAPSASDNCSIKSFVSSHNPGDAFSHGVTTVTYRAIDDSDNAIECSFDVTVNDNISPVITNCPADIVMDLSGADCNESVNWTLPVATDNCKVNTFVSSHNPGDEFPLGSTTVTYTATDQAGNTAVCDFDVTINDNTSPVITDCPADLVVNLTGSDCEVAVSWSPPSASDNCSVSTFSSSHDPGDRFSPGTTVVSYTAQDPSGNETVCSFNVTVEDHIAPVIEQCSPTLIISDYDNVLEEAIVSWDVPTASDNCEPATLLGTHNPGDSFPKGTTTVSYTARDASGNTTSCSFDVEVTGNGVPVVQPKAVITEDAIPVKVCLEATDPDDDPLVLKAVNYVSTNGEVVWENDDSSLCFTYTSNEKYEGIETFPVLVCDNQVPAACTEIAVKIEVFIDKEPVIYKAFTPDNDNINDKWMIENIEYYPDNKVMIFDRWGSLVYSATGYDNEGVIWDGSSNQGVFSKGKLVPSGTYYFVIDLGNGQTIRKGFLELVQ